MGVADEAKSKAEALGDQADDALNVVKDKLEDLGDKAHDALDDLQVNASGMLQDVKEHFDADQDGQTSFGDVVETVRTKAGELFDDVKDKIGGEDADQATDDTIGSTGEPVPGAAVTSRAEEPVEDFAADGPSPETLPKTAPETVVDDLDAVAEEAEELERHSQPGNL